MNLERKVEERTLSLRLVHAELDQRNNDLESAMQDLKDAQSQLVDVAHRAGMTEIATGVLHNVGNVLNSVNVSVSVLHEDLRKSRTSNIARVATLVKDHNDLFASHSDPKVQQVPQYLGLLAESVASERRRMGEELANLSEKVEHIKNIINAQQNSRGAWPSKRRSICVACSKISLDARSGHCQARHHRRMRFRGNSDHYGRKNQTTASSR